MENKYAILQETNGDEYESWLYFIKYNGNEENLKYLDDQINSIDWYIIDGTSTFDLELKNLVSETTANEMCMVELNHSTYNRKFNGILQKIDLKLKKKYSNEKKIAKVFSILGYGRIENFIDDEVIFHPIGPEEVEESESEYSNEESESETDEDIYESSDEDDIKCKELPNNLKPNKS
jgi:hypothetical protein